MAIEHSSTALAMPGESSASYLAKLTVNDLPSGLMAASHEPGRPHERLAVTNATYAPLGFATSSVWPRAAADSPCGSGAAEQPAVPTQARHAAERKRRERGFIRSSA